MKRIVIGLTLILSMIGACLVGSVTARDLDGRYANSPLKPWFDHLASGKGLCCSVADGESVADPDWESKDGHYRVRLDNNWVDVPDDAVVTEPNRAGRTMVWPIRFDNQISIRCFMPGSMPQEPCASICGWKSGPSRRRTADLPAGGFLYRDRHQAGSRSRCALRRTAT